ncbi:amidase [Bacillus sp. EB106-08-02-XG196]|jgi:amidase|uniref:amidase family protein n=1 Tax=Bacillus sp. EB106-08-02-XG196 TaxID=2737049 RepID=UPI0015C4BE43|nr:amidase family protein [Bacillus sp. EB106-08-02-XG196]NWQ40597.1 amidase [Bacillus sp. EB106-08-02-XG196]
MENYKLKKYLNEWIEEATITQMQEKMTNGELTSKELVMMYLHRISVYDKRIHSIIEVNPDALHIAAALDAERKETGPRSALHGIPILLKDNIDTADKMHTSAGSLALKESIALQDSYVAEQLRKAGVVILGKTNMTEWANFMAIGMKSGYSSRGGQVLNPYGPDKFDVGGSSSGSGAAIAANLAAASIGTETSGSILNPACQNSLVGIKPTVGLISRKGIIPIAHTQDTAGPMARSVRDAALLLNAITGRDEDDAITRTNPLVEKDFTEHLRKDGLKGKRIGIASEGFIEQVSEEKQKIYHEAVAILEAAGAEIIEPLEIPSAREKWSYDVLTYEFKPDLNAYLNSLHPSISIRTLKDLIQFNNENEEQMLKYGQAVLINSDATSGSLTEAEYVKALEFDDYHSTKRGIDYALEKYQLDAILFPSEEGSHISAKAGYPTIAVPAGYTSEGEPVGITFAGTAYSEPQLIEAAYAFEQLTKFRKAPVFRVE